MRNWPELHQRILDLERTLREHGIYWRPFDEPRTALRRGSRVPADVGAEMKEILAELREVVPSKADADEAWWFAEECRQEWARSYPERSADFEELAARSLREGKADWEGYYRLLAEVQGEPLWGTLRFLEPDEPAPSVLAEGTPDPGDPARGDESMAELGFQALWPLVLAWESGALEEGHAKPQ